MAEPVRCPVCTSTIINGGPEKLGRRTSLAPRARLAERPTRNQGKRPCQRTAADTIVLSPADPARVRGEVGLIVRAHNGLALLAERAKAAAADAATPPGITT